MDDVPTPEQDLAWRLANIERRLEGISDRLGGLESSLRAAVAEEGRGATAELRRAISELGRRLVQDLPHELARHRDAIVAELRSAPLPSPVPGSASRPDPIVNPEAEAVGDDPRTTGTPKAPKSRRARRRLRRRQG